jgi:hypothetical protein
MNVHLADLIDYDALLQRFKSGFNTTLIMLGHFVIVNSFVYTYILIDKNELNRVNIYSKICTVVQQSIIFMSYFFTK